MKFMILGGAGFIGSNFVRYLAELKTNELFTPEFVSVIDKLTYAGRYENIQDVIEKKKWAFHQVDICNSVAMTSLLETHKPDVLVNFAAESHVSRSITDPESFVRTNVMGVQTAMEAVRQKSPETLVVHISTDEVFGSSSEWGKSWNDYDQLNPRSPYAASKASGELIARSYFTTYGIDTIIVRPSNCFGEYQHPEKLIPRSVTNLLRGDKIKLMGAGSEMRDWLYVSDLCFYLSLIIEEKHSGECYNIPGNAIHRNREIVRKILNKMNVSWKNGVETIPHRLAHDFKYHVEGEGIKTLLAPYPSALPSKNSFDSKLNTTIEWYKNNVKWWEPLVAEAERGNQGADTGRKE